jgi:hypothetical protein
MDGNFPFLHLDRKFMHLGFHIYDVGFQSPNVEAARPLVYATSFFLVLVVMPAQPVRGPSTQPPARKIQMPWTTEMPA